MTTPSPEETLREFLNTVGAHYSDCKQFNPTKWPEHINVCTCPVAEAREALERLVGDSRRLDWIESHVYSMDYTPDGFEQDELTWESQEGETARQAIDEALQAAEGDGDG